VLSEINFFFEYVLEIQRGKGNLSVDESARGINTKVK
jgi:hypothetical protein